MELLHEDLLVFIVSLGSEDGKCIHGDDNVRWIENGKLHRVPSLRGDLPALIYSDDDRYWYNHGRLHRNRDRPATVHADSGGYSWYQNGTLYRSGGKPTTVGHGG